MSISTSRTWAACATASRTARYVCAVGEEQDAASATRAADLRGSRPGIEATRDQSIYGGSRDLRGKVLSKLPFCCKLPTHLRPIVTLNCPSHHDRDVTDPFEESDDLGVAVEMSLGGSPSC